ncbi:MAG: hypothetical protein OXT49_00950 [Gammaproteobacteria bacterium]|nr:hypothetical protein [Gammaproteobacteria bacterium]
MPKLARLYLFICSIIIGAPLSANEWLTEAQLLASQGKDAAALSSLWQGLGQQASQEQGQGFLLAAELCARNGLIELARSYYLKRLSNPQPIASGDRYAIARFFADQKEWQRVKQTLAAHWQSFPGPLKAQARNLLGLANLTLGAPSNAEQTLGFPRHRSQALPYRRYNLAIAKHQQGKTFEARKQLQQIATQPVYTVEQAIFKDRLHVQLAQHYLKFEQGGFATPLLQDIKYRSPYANSALLMLGWAALTPGGETSACQTLAASQGCWIETDQQGRDIQRSKTSISQTFAALRPKPGQRVSRKTQAQLTQAISSWVLLADKTEPTTSSFQNRELLAQLEAKVSLGYALQISGHLQAALTRYQQALTALQKNANAPYLESLQPLFISKLQTLRTEFQQSGSTPNTLKAKALTAIDNALVYRQETLALEQQSTQAAWQNITTEYRKQAHLGLASLHEQMSYQ